jgi:hypothetical protein
LGFKNSKPNIPADTQIFDIMGSIWLALTTGQDSQGGAPPQHVHSLQ